MWSEVVRWQWGEGEGSVHTTLFSREQKCGPVVIMIIILNCLYHNTAL
jgi:hypothetical protein